MPNPVGCLYFSYRPMRLHCGYSWIKAYFKLVAELYRSSFVVSFFVLTYFLNRPCVYCSILLFILFISSCYWSDQCFFDIYSNWFEPRYLSPPLADPSSQFLQPAPIGNDTSDDVSFVVQAINDTATALAGGALEELKRRASAKPEWTGVGMEWIRSWLGAREWRLPCLDVYIRL